MRIDDISVGSADDLADCLESYVLSSSSSAIGIGALQRFAEDCLNVGDASFAFALSRLRLRAKSLAGLYPLTFDFSSIVRADGWERYPYTSFLLMSNTSLASFDEEERNSVSPERWFEEIVLTAMKTWLGPESLGLRFGWPSEIGRPAEFPEAIRWLSEKINVELGSAYRPPIRKDGGVDVVVWRPFGDNRSGFPIVLVQCTLQKDLISKSRDIDISNWSGWLALDRQPWTVLATPRIIPDGTDRWNQLNRQSLVFERLRLTRYSPKTLDSPEFDRIVKSCCNSFEAVQISLEH